MNPTRMFEEPPAPALALFGSVQSNYLALEAGLSAAAKLGIDRVYGLGDLVGLGPFPERSVRLILDRKVGCLLGEMELFLKLGFEDVDRAFSTPGEEALARVGHEYTRSKLSAEMAEKLAGLPHQIRLTCGGHRVLLTHGSPSLVAEGCWESREDVEYVGWFDEFHVDVIVCDHTGLPWMRQVAPGRWMVNVGSLGRPANNGRREGTMAVLRAGAAPTVEFMPVGFDWQRFVAEVRAEGLPEEIWQTVEEGYWQYFLDSLPPLERARGRY